MRSDQVDFIEKEFNGKLPYDHGTFYPLVGVVKGGSGGGGMIDVVNLNRDVNVAHFWDWGSNLLDGIKRDGVLHYLDDHQRDHHPAKIFHLNTFGTRSNLVRNNIQS